MKNGCMGIIFYEFIFRIVGNFFSCQYKLGAAVTGAVSLRKSHDRNIIIKGQANHLMDRLN